MAPRLSVLALIAAVTLGGCAYGDYGGSRVSVGYGSAGYYDPYYGYYGYPAYGWYDGYYYPGRGYYVYDRGGRRHAMRDHDRRHWLERRTERRDRQWVDRKSWRDGAVRRDREWGDRKGWRDGAVRRERDEHRAAEREARRSQVMERWQQRAGRSEARTDAPGKAGWRFRQGHKRGD